MSASRTSSVAVAVNERWVYTRGHRRIGLREAFDLLGMYPDDSPQLNPWLAAAASRRRHVFCGSLAAAVVPVYVTSICRENCQYCNFSRTNRGRHLDRRRLAPVELERELEYLILDRGYRALELVYASDPGVSARDVATHVELCRRLLDAVGGGLVGVNAPSMTTDEYRELADAGLGFAVQWQETYDRERYAVYHARGGLKADYDYRYNAYARMLRAGIQHIGMGILLGLAPWREDWRALIQHEDRILDEFGVRPAILGTARLKPAAGAKVQRTTFLPTDDEFVYAIAVHALFSPQTVPWVSTREPWELCVRLAQGGCLFTFDCSTTPGGYTQQRPSYQFPTHSFPADIFGLELEEHGLRPTFEWRFGQHGGLQPGVPLREAMVSTR